MSEPTSPKPTPDGLFELDAPDLRNPRAASGPVQVPLPPPPPPLGRADSAPLLTFDEPLPAPPPEDAVAEAAVAEAAVAEPTAAETAAVLQTTEPAEASEPSAAAEPVAAEAAPRRSRVTQPDAADAKPLPARPERLVALPLPEPARSAEEQHEQRRARLVDRTVTARDALLLLSEVSTLEEQRKALGPMWLELQATLGGNQTASMLKDPKAAFAGANKDALDGAERVISAIEDKLFAIDEQVDDAVFEERAKAAQEKKLVARYGRLLASRRLSIGTRRNRFEWIALHLLTRANAKGELVVLPPDRARNVLAHLIGGLPRKLRQEEVEGATDYLYDAGTRVDRLRTIEELFETGLLADIHGYKVTMREHMTSPELLYRVVLLEAKLHNRLERLIADEALVRGGDREQVTSEVRALVRERTAAERYDVDGRLGARPRSPSSPPSADEAAAKKRAGAAVAKAAAKAQRRRMAMDRGLLVVIATVIVLSVSVYVVRDYTGLGKPEVTQRKLTAEEMPGLSPLLVTGDVRTSGEDGHLHGWISGRRWRALDPAARKTAAESLAAKLAAAGIRSADLLDHNTTVIVIRDGILISAAGAAP